jgi:hypothetical protein
MSILKMLWDGPEKSFASFKLSDAKAHANVTKRLTKKESSKELQIFKTVMI